MLFLLAFVFFGIFLSLFLFLVVFQLCNGCVSMTELFQAIKFCENTAHVIGFFVDAHLFIFWCVNLVYGKESIFEVSDNGSC